MPALRNAISSMVAGKGFFGAVGQISGLTAISRVLGFIRDILIAVFIGAGPVADAFFVAFKLPNLFRRITAEGAMTNAFMPAYSRARQESDEAAASMASEIQITLLWGLVMLTIVMEIAMPVVISLIAPGFEQGSARHSDAIEFARLTMPFLPMISMVALWAAITNAHDHFWGGAAAPIILNLCLIIGAVACGLGAWVKAFPLAVAIPLSGVFQLILLHRMLLRVDRKPRWMIWPRIGRHSRTMWRSFFPAALGAGGMQINLLVDTILASLLPVGAISALYFADRIAQLPLGIIGIALGTALLPRLSRLEAEGNHSAVGDALAKGCQLGLFFGIPAMAGSIILAEAIIGGLFAYGAFDASRIEPVAMVLVAYSIGIPAFILVKVLQPAFFAAGDTRTPMLISFATIIINIGLSLMLMRHFGAAGLALATALASWVSVLILAVMLVKRDRISLVMIELFIPTLLLTAVMAAVILLVQYGLARYPLPLSAGQRAAELVVMVSAGLVAYFGLAWRFRAWPRDRQPSHPLTG